MDVYELCIKRSSDKQIAELLKDLSEENEKLKKGFNAAKALIDSYFGVGNPEFTDRQGRNYDEYHVAIRGLE